MAVVFALCGCATSSSDQGGDAGGDGSDGGCMLDTPDNCGACGTSCDQGMSVQSATCGVPDAGPGGDAAAPVCSYTCAAGYTDCNSMTGLHQPLPFNSDGCECMTPGVNNVGCCMGSMGWSYGQCPVPHMFDSSMSSSAFNDCEPAGAYSNQLALDACVAFAGNGKCDNTFTCSDGTKMVCSSRAATCNCWGYDGPGSGKVHHGSMGMCTCPGAMDMATYN